MNNHVYIEDRNDYDIIIINNKKNRKYNLLSSDKFVHTCSDILGNLGDQIEAEDPQIFKFIEKGSKFPSLLRVGRKKDQIIYDINEALLQNFDHLKVPENNSA